MESLYGLELAQLKIFMTTLLAFSEHIETCYVFGSRVRNDYKSYSDIDLAIELKQSSHLSLTEVRQAFEDSTLIHTVDIIDLSSVNNDQLEREIVAEGKLVYKSSAEGDRSMDELQRLQLKMMDLDRANQRLQEVVDNQTVEQGIIIDATIQRFEFTFELSWKLMKHVLAYNGVTNVNSPRGAIREAFKQGYIEDAQKWLIMLDDRNRTSHTYDLDTAQDIFSKVQSTYADLLKVFSEKVSDVLKAELE